MFIITAVGADHPGMAHGLAQILFESGCNIEDTTMTRLSGQFSMILAVEAPDGVSIESLATKLEALRDSHGLVVDITDVEEAPENKSNAPRFILTAYGAEKTGLLATLTGILAQKGVNVTDVQTRVASGGAVYVMLLELELPESLSAAELETALKTGAPDLQISLRELDEETL